MYHAHAWQLGCKDFFYRPIVSCSLCTISLCWTLTLVTVNWLVEYSSLSAKNLKCKIWASVKFGTILVCALFGHSVFKFNQEMNSCCQEVISIYSHQIEFSILNSIFKEMILSHSTSIFHLDSHKIEFSVLNFFSCHAAWIVVNSIPFCHATFQTFFFFLTVTLNINTAINNQFCSAVWHSRL